VKVVIVVVIIGHCIYLYMGGKVELWGWIQGREIEGGKMGGGEGRWGNVFCAGIIMMLCFCCYCGRLR
jgi:hypothetical protein